ncbi:MAG: ABC transporter ATP-binding protein [Dehalococcoidia bacterium]
MEARGVSVSYGDTTAVRLADLRLHAGEKVALMGPSGSGKSTLLYCMAGVLPPDQGEVWFEGRRLDTLRDGQRSDLRLRRMGVVFQFGDLVPELTLVENVMLPLLLAGQRDSRARQAAMEALDALGVASVAGRRAGAVSGGQAQRAAVARAVVHKPPVIFADEPTGSLDTVNAEAVLDVLVALATDRGTALLVVTHDHQVASHLDRLVTMRDGALREPVSVAAR